MTATHDPKQKLAMMARHMRIMADQASALAAVLEKAHHEQIEHTGDMQVGWERIPDEIPNEELGMITLAQTGGELIVTFEGNLRVRLLDGSYTDSFFDQFKAAMQ